jgi:hypothetical protein
VREQQEKFSLIHVEVMRVRDNPCAPALRSGYLESVDSNFRFGRDHFHINDSGIVRFPVTSFIVGLITLWRLSGVGGSKVAFST